MITLKNQTHITRLNIRAAIDTAGVIVLRICDQLQVHGRCFVDLSDMKSRVDHLLDHLRFMKCVTKAIVTREMLQVVCSISGERLLPETDTLSPPAATVPKKTCLLDV